jgi:hypothetical protein
MIILICVSYVDAQQMFSDENIFHSFACVPLLLFIFAFSHKIVEC